MGYQQPGSSDTHIDVALTNMSVAFLQAPSAFVADRVFPLVPVQNKSNKYFTFPRGALMRDEFEKRAPGARSAVANYTISNDSYDADVWSMGYMIDDMAASNVDAPLDLDRQALDYLAQKALIHRERKWVSAFFTSGIWTGDQTGVDNAAPTSNQFGRWDRSDSNPIETVRAQCDTMQARTGFRPNKMVMGRQVFSKLIDHPDLVGRVDRGQTVGAAQVQKDQLAALFEMDEILVMESVYNSAAEGAADSIGYIGGKSALLIYVPSAPGLSVPSAGYTFSWIGIAPAVPGAIAAVQRIRAELEHSWVIEMSIAYAHKVVSADLGVFFITAIN